MDPKKSHVLVKRLQGSTNVFVQFPNENNELHVRHFAFHNLSAMKFYNKIFVRLVEYIL